MKVNVRRGTQWAGQFAAATELCRRGYEVSFTLGNEAPGADLFVRSPSGELFQVEVKGARKIGNWLAKGKSVKGELFYIFVLVPGDLIRPCEYFIVPQTEVIQTIERSRRKAEVRWAKGLRKTHYRPGVGVRFARKHKDNREILPK